MFPFVAEADFDFLIGLLLASNEVTIAERDAILRLTLQSMRWKGLSLLR
ncbi:hypothetical protein ACVR1I_00175 [Streptococcus cameli]